MITVHHLNQSRSKRVLWLLEELNLPYQLINHQRDPITQLAPESLKAIHPLAKAPVIVDGDVTLCESGAIMEYILNQNELGALRPQAGSPEYYAYLEWLHFAKGSLGLPVISTLFMQMETRDGTQAMDHYIGKEVALDFGYIETTLENKPFFAGENFTAADIMMTFTLEVAHRIGLLESRLNTQDYLERVQSRDAYKKAASFG
ncbi:glutathione S-transferase family protein [Shewanella sp. 202IG2-18]|uniref:glutathione S-transferase family protein n=1 Tax=Parashewanella hymeniacidonis TaxID=2807618 RepID=UPI001961A3FF|nr:glutathione S-transferase family protein [Parashewanella hymeniacidonis]MBM7072269.1 glutathione S-transferase family protein [Parashewanella hymeniacidonis]